MLTLGAGSEPTVFENYVHTIQPARARYPVEMTLWDTAGQEEFDKLRTLSYADTHVVVLCFAADNPVSLENVETRVSDTSQTSPSTLSFH
jgi:Rho family protein